MINSGRIYRLPTIDHIYDVFTVITPHEVYLLTDFFLDVCCQNCDGFLSAKLKQLLQLMIEVLPSCHFSAKRHRLHCLYFLIVHVSKVLYNSIDSFRVCCS